MMNGLLGSRTICQLANCPGFELGIIASSPGVPVRMLPLQILNLAIDMKLAIWTFVFELIAS